MSSKGRSSSGRAVLAVAVLLAANTVGAAPRTLKLAGWDKAAVERARGGALRRLRQAECQKLFTDFRTAEGRTLQEALAEWAESPAAYVELVPFVDGSSQANCRQPNVALTTSPGVRRVFVCKAFADFQLRQPGVAESMVIHEILHTLGLGENPPTSIEITQRVEARCR
jgi:hypothetical protein